MGWESPSHWLIIAIVVIALFGYKKLPDAARAIGRSLRTFKSELHGMSEDDKARDDAAHTGKTPAADAGTAQAPAEPEPEPQATGEQQPKP